MSPLFLSSSTFRAIINPRLFETGSCLLHTQTHGIPDHFPHPCRSLSENTSLAMTCPLSYRGPSSPLHFSDLHLCPHPTIIQKYSNCEIKLYYTIPLMIHTSFKLLTSVFSTNRSLLFSLLSQFSLEIVTHCFSLCYHLCPQVYCISISWIY